jgi:excisionase family DNA binding protein
MSIAPNRTDEIIRLRQEGLTYSEIGLRFGVTKERVRQLSSTKSKNCVSTKRELRSNSTMLTAGSVAKLLGLHPNTVRRWSQKGILKAYRVGPRGDRRFRHEDIEAFLGESGSNGNI